MVLLELDQVLAVAAQVLDCDVAAAIRRTDLDALELAVAEQRTAAAAGDTATAAAGLLRGLVRHRPFRGPNRTIAVAATLQLLALNGCDLELEPVGEIDALLDKIAADAVNLTALADQLSLRIVPLATTHPKGEGMFERFSKRARQVVVLAQEEARQLQHDYIGTEHILLGLIHEGEGVAATVLRELGISLEQVRTLVVEMVGPGKEAPPGHIPFTPRAKKVLELALREAIQLGHNYIGTEHILLGLVREGKGVAAEVLVKLGAGLNRVRGQVIEQLGGDEGRDVEGLPGEVDLSFLLEGLGRRDLRRGRRIRLLSEVKAVLAENDRLRAENERLRGLLRDHGIDPAA
jgi:prophage maintenance system killer protein